MRLVTSGFSKEKQNKTKQTKAKSCVFCFLSFPMQISSQLVNLCISNYNVKVQISDCRIQPSLNTSSFFCVVLIAGELYELSSVFTAVYTRLVTRSVVGCSFHDNRWVSKITEKQQKSSTLSCWLKCIILS